MHPKELMILLMFLASLMIIAFAAGHYIDRKKKETSYHNNLELYYQKGRAQGWKEATEDIDQKLINLTK